MWASAEKLGAVLGGLLLGLVTVCTDLMAEGVSYAVLARLFE